MAKFSRASLAALATCDERLQLLMHECIKYIDFKVLEGHRGQEAQDAAFAAGNSQLRWPHGKHNASPSRAVDIAPWPINWNDTQRFVLFAGFILGVASQLNIRVRWGGDWNQDTQVRDERFRDWGHFELAD